MEEMEITFTHKGKKIEATIVLVYQEAIASGSAEYVNVTILMVKVKRSIEVIHIYPRQVETIKK